ncbi:Hypothetical protein NCS54_00372500 [Fusarium falciforme]|uniref:Uncharacterized protein n=1 Tax=Fusarium falciforme TaxID=195108 RepID=A0A9W8R7G7_9HYPO|nr:Hypothetical protein NCS54_00372500 [Fusarium falciforme]KAJ4190230.1 hypothetical protein NW755_005370 [Fusarium falciforme]KAJ4202550.1 hypothetical protein NW767_005921 [Fusarium falciforme]KAJ4253620.1 hypothetical protein NW757_005574 [Fusarium falciforme]WAO86452.1 Hypothetical protein NCS54_00372500 [Fusarium falciforme]
MAPLLSPQDLGFAKLLARASATLSPPTLVVRQNSPTTTVAVISDDDGDNGTQLSGGAIAGIVIGSIFGFLLLLWIFRSCMNLGAPPQEREKWYHYKEKSPPRRHSHRSRSRRRRSSISVPPSVVVRDSRPRSYRRSVSPGYYYSDSDRGRGSRYYV